MSQQPEQTSISFAPNPAPTPGSANGHAPEAQTDAKKSEKMPHRIPRWLESAELFLRILLRTYIGLAICYLPWSRTFWDQNPLFLHFPALGYFAFNGAVRGLVSGLGLLNLWIAFHNAFRRRDG
jgi:hypothetical protein